MPVPRAPLRILIADDHRVVRAGLSALLEQEKDMAVIAEASNGEEAVALWTAHRPDVTLMDLSMPALGGVAAIREIREIDPLARVIVLTTFDGDGDIYNAMRAGAKGYLLKDTDPNELFAAIRKVWEGKSYLPAEVAGKLAERLDGDTLTDRELEILQLVANGQSNKLIARALDITEGTVKTHLKNILGKLDATSRTEAAAIAQKRGIVHL